MISNTEEPSTSAPSWGKSDGSRSIQPYRFIRCNPRFNRHETISMLAEEVNCDPFPIAVPWLDEYYAIPGGFNLQKSKSFQSARIYGQDVSSGAAVTALLSSMHDIGCSFTDKDTAPKNKEHTLRILDLCCCPGLKLCAVADMLYQSGESGEIIGVDISHSRMAVCKRILHKYQIEPLLNKVLNSSDSSNVTTVQNSRIQLFCNDGRSFGSINVKDMNLIFDSEASFEDESSRKGKRKRMNKSARAREAKRLKEESGKYTARTSGTTVDLFDRVLVDAECSTDGSIIHVQKQFLQTNTSDGSNTNLASKRKFTTFNEDQLVELYALQKDLASSGFQLLREGGYMVYSTCSLSDKQNGAIVQWLLNKYPNASIVPLDFLTSSKLENSADYSAFVKHGSVAGTIQFFPNVHDSKASDCKHEIQLFGGGFYVAKIKKGKQVTI